MKLMLNGKEVSGMGHYVMAGDIKDAATTPDKVLAPNVFYGNDGRQIGTMPNRGGMSAELAAGGSTTIPEGYHNGEGVVRAQDLASQTQGTAEAANIEAGYTAWVNGEMVEGTGKMDPFTLVKNVSFSSSGFNFAYTSQNNYLRLTDRENLIWIVPIYTILRNDVVVIGRGKSSSGSSGSQGYTLSKYSDTRIKVAAPSNLMNYMYSIEEVSLA